MIRIALENGYEIREVETTQFGPLWEPHGQAIFESNVQTFRFREALSEAELAKIQALRANLGAPYRLNLAVYRGDEFVGWSWGQQETAETFYMVNSAILPEHRGRGLYQALVAAMIEETAARGFQKLYSRHIATNNAVIVPKLKAGFVITGMELSDQYGTLVVLTYFPHPTRRKVLDYRAGGSKPDVEIGKLLRF